MSRAAFDRLLVAVGDLFEEYPVLAAFDAFPEDLEWSGLPPEPLEMASQVAGWHVDGTSPVHEFHQSVQSVAPEANWRQTYSEAEVGADFLANYGYFELYGPTGHFHCGSARAFVAYWGAGLTYDWHHHAAEELYFVVSGAAVFQCKGKADATLTRGMTRRHDVWQRHAMKTRDRAILTFVLWRGEGLEQPPKLYADL